MIHTYKITGMKCDGCIENVKKALNSIDGITELQIKLDAPQAILNMENEISISTLQQALSNTKFIISNT